MISRMHSGLSESMTDLLLPIISVVFLSLRIIQFPNWKEVIFSGISTVQSFYLSAKMKYLSALISKDYFSIIMKPVL